MKISIDFDGTLWSHKAFFRQLMLSMQAAGHQVGILTGHGIEGREADLAYMAGQNIPTPDFFFAKDTDEYKAQNGSVFKSDVIMREGIDIHFDDCDYGNPDSSRIFDERLGPLAYKVVRMRHREPGNVHYE